jgi:phage-related protein
MENEKQLVWVGSSKEALLTFPEEMVNIVGFALGCAQHGETHPDAKKLVGKQFKGKGVFEVVDNFDGDAYRAVYTVKLKGRIYVLHSFMKKSKKGIATPKHDIDLILDMFKAAEKIHAKLNADIPEPELLKKYLEKHFYK